MYGAIFGDIVGCWDGSNGRVSIAIEKLQIVAGLGIHLQREAVVEVFRWTFHTQGAVPHTRIDDVGGGAYYHTGLHEIAAVVEFLLAFHAICGYTRKKQCDGNEQTCCNVDGMLRHVAMIW